MCSKDTITTTTADLPVQALITAGVILPLLANIALHGLENHLNDCVPEIPVLHLTSCPQIL